MAKHTLDYTGEELDKLLSSIAGYVVRSSEKEEDGLFHVRGFKDEDSYNNWFADKDNNYELVLTHFTIPDTASTTASYVLNLTNGSGSYIVSTDGTVKIKLRFISALYNPIDQSTTDTGEQGVLTVQTRISETSQWATRGTTIIRSLPKDSKDFIEVDISNFLSDGSQYVRIIVRGDTSESSTNYVQMEIVKTSLSLTFANSWQIPLYNAAMPLAYRISGAVEKTLHLKIDNGARIVEQYIGSTTYVETPYTVTVNDLDATLSAVCTQGIHTIEAWLTVAKEGVNVESDHITSQVLIILDPSLEEKYVWFNDVDLSVTNWTEQSLMKYAVYNSSGDTLPLTFVLSDYSREEIYATYDLGNVAEGVQYEFSNMIEIEDSRKNFSARIDVKTGNKVLKEFVLDIDNSQNFSPTEGADFIFNPKLRSNQEQNRDTVINAVNGEVIDATFNGYGFVNDAYTTDESGNKCFRTVAGDSLYITGYEAFSDFMGNEHTGSLTMEFDFAVRNITDEEDTIIRMCTYNNGFPVGLEIKPLGAVFGTLGLQTRLDQDVAWEEGVRTHLAVNIVYNLSASGINYIRLFINGKINREMSYKTNDTFVQFVNGIKTSEGILIGAPKAEIDIYSIRIYKKALSSNDVMQDYVASLPTTEQKLAFREANNIVGDNGINYAYAKEKYNTLLWKPNNKTEGGKARLATYGDKAKQLFYGDLVVNIVGDPVHSGTLYNQNTQGQGTSSMSYWKWNQRFQPDDDGYFVNENGERFDYWQLMDGMPRSSRNDAKLNWASPQQSHKMGATALYNDCWKKIIKNNTITLTEGGQSFTGTEGGYADCRVAVGQKSFMMFVQETDSSNPVFYGMFTMGPGKGDKPTFGYDKKKFPDFTMLEGCDNNKALVMHRVPWDNAIGGSLDDEVWTYNGEDNWELSMGSGNLWEEFVEAFNFVYKLHTKIAPYTKGDLAKLKADDTADQSIDYWMTTSGTGYAIYDLYRYDIVEGDWVKAGLNKTTFNINQQCGNIASGTDWDAINEKFIEARLKFFRPYDMVNGSKIYRTGEGIEKYYHVQDALFTMMFLRLVCATDNRGKNTYLYKAVAGDKIMFFQDDLDTIFLTDNVGRKTKPYYIEEHDLDENNKPYWNSSSNAFYNLMEIAYADEMKDMMKSILTAMSELGGGTLDGCYQKYFYNVQEDIPAIAYNEIARLLYEEAAKAVEDGVYTPNTAPLPQCLGDQLLAEKEWNKKRSVYLSSYASYGEFASGEVSGAFSFRSVLTTSGAAPRYKFTVVPHQWIYPANGTGDSVFPSNTRVRTGETYTFPERTSDGNTNVRINGINYYRSIGNLGDKAAGSALAGILGERLTEFIATAENPEFRITSITNVAAPNLELLDLTGIVTLSGSIDLSKQRRLKTLKLQGTSLTSVVFPDTDALTSVELPKTLTSISISKQPNLVSVKFEGTENLSTIRIDHSEAKSFNSQGLIENLYSKYVNTGVSPNSITILDADWNEISTGVLTWLIDKIPEVRLTGSISIKEPNSSASNINFELKNRINAKFGNVDSEDSELRLIYNIVPLNSVKLVGSFDNGGDDTAQFSITPSPANANGHTKIRFSLDREPQFSEVALDEETGFLRATELSASEDSATISVVANKVDGSQLTNSLVVPIWNREAQVGDLVYYDGTYNSPDYYDGTKTVAGVCFYTAPKYPNGEIVEELHKKADIHRRLMITIADISVRDSNGNTYTVFENYPNIGYFYALDELGNKISCTSGSLSTIYDVVDISSVKSYADNMNITTDKFLADNTDELGVLNYGIRPFRYDDSAGTGFAYEEIDVTERTLTAEIAELAGEGYKEGDVVNMGYASTLKMIRHRNAILTNGIPELGIEPNTDHCQIPFESDTQKESTSFANLLTAIATYGQSTQCMPNIEVLERYCVPTASAAYSYEPSVKKGELLNPKFKRHNWFIPPSGVLARFHFLGTLHPDRPLEKAKAKIGLVVSKQYNDVRWTCSKFSLASNMFSGAPGSVYNGLDYGYSAWRIRPICAF
jgi:hypothetical protein